MYRGNIRAEGPELETSVDGIGTSLYADIAGGLTPRVGRKPLSEERLGSEPFTWGLNGGLLGGLGGKKGWSRGSEGWSGRGRL